MNENNPNTPDETPPPLPGDETQPDALLEPGRAAPAPADAFDPDSFDPANKSLADALRVSFTLLMIVMAVLAIVFVLSNTRNVDEGTVAVKLMFGAVVGDPGQQVCTPGGPYWLWPEPVGRFVEVETTQQTLELDKAFWYAGDDLMDTLSGSRQAENRAAQNGLIPGVDGSLITGDQNIVHARFSVNYQITADGAVSFITNVSADPIRRDMRAAADAIVRAVAEAAIVRIVAEIPADEFIRDGIANTPETNFRQNRLVRGIQSTLDQMGSGISINAVTVNNPTAPIAIARAFSSVNQAVNTKDTKISEARRDAIRILNDAAGSQHRALVEAINNYEDARASGDEQHIRRAEHALNKFFEPDAAEGQVAAILGEASQYRATVVQDLEAEAQRFRSLREAYERNPQVELSRLWSQTLTEMLSADTEIFFLTDAQQLVLDFNRDPDIAARREAARYQAESESSQSRPDYTQIDLLQRMSEEREKFERRMNQRNRTERFDIDR